MNSLKSLRLGLLLVALVSCGFAAELAGGWTAQIDTPVGRWVYLYTFKVNNGVVEGVATLSRDGSGKVDLPLQELTFEGDQVTFRETVVLDGMDIVIWYRGTLAGDEIRFVRDVGEFAQETFTARRVTAGGTTKSGG